MNPKGTYVGIGAPGGRWTPVIAMLKPVLLSPFVSQRLVPCVSKMSRDDLVVLKKLIETGKVTPVIDRSYPLREVPQAIRYLEQGHARGKVVISMG
jgi:NADPH:quinone reductase-like Zn-dependent oxidoreductase